MYPQVSIIILNWNGKEDTIECLESLKNITYPNYEILLVDNGSTDGSVDCFRKRHPEIEIIENGENLGFAEGNNVGIRYALKKEADYILLLNNDTVVDSSFLEELIKVAETGPKIGFIGPTVFDYGSNTEGMIGGEINWLRGSCKKIRFKELNYTEDKIYNVDFVSGCCLLVKKDVINEIGLLDPDYFLYYEETDWNVRAASKGYSSVIAPKSRIWHKEGRKTKINNIWAYYDVRNNILFMKKNAHFPYRHIYKIFLIKKVLFYLTIGIMKHEKNIIKNTLKGFYDGTSY